MSSTVTAATTEKRTRDPEKTRAHILEVAFKEVRAQGFQGISLNEIIDRTAVTKGAFFHHFGTKQDLGYALVDEILRGNIIQMWIRPLESYRNPLQGILDTLKRTIDGMPAANLIAGCPLNNLSQEMSAVDPVFRRKLLAITSFWIEEIERYLVLAQERGYLRPGCPTRQLAEFVVLLHEGAIGLAKIAQDKAILYSAHRSLKLHLRAVSATPAQTRLPARTPRARARYRGR